jgi:hypothetical protein
MPGRTIQESAVAGAGIGATLGVGVGAAVGIGVCPASGAAAMATTVPSSGSVLICGPPGMHP